MASQKQLFEFVCLLLFLLQVNPRATPVNSEAPTTNSTIVTAG